MAVEHLTKKKLIQLLVVLFVLIVAFTLRTCNYQHNNIKKSVSENHIAQSEKLTTTNSISKINKKEAKAEVKHSE